MRRERGGEGKLDDNFLKTKEIICRPCEKQLKITRCLFQFFFNLSKTIFLFETFKKTCEIQLVNEKKKNYRKSRYNESHLKFPFLSFVCPPPPVPRPRHRLQFDSIFFWMELIKSREMTRNLSGKPFWTFLLSLNLRKLPLNPDWEKVLKRKIKIKKILKELPPASWH